MVRTEESPGMILEDRHFSRPRTHEVGGQSTSKLIHQGKLDKPQDTVAGSAVWNLINKQKNQNHNNNNNKKMQRQEHPTRYRRVSSSMILTKF